VWVAGLFFMTTTQSLEPFDPLAALAENRAVWCAYVASTWGVSPADETFLTDFDRLWVRLDHERMSDLTVRVVRYLRAHSFSYSSLLLTLN
jgi:hypothetical protein